MIYDTIYAHQDKADDIKIGIKSTAIAWGTPNNFIQRRQNKRRDENPQRSSMGPIPNNRLPLKLRPNLLPNHNRPSFLPSPNNPKIRHERPSLLQRIFREKQQLRPLRFFSNYRWKFPKNPKQNR